MAEVLRRKISTAKLRTDRVVARRANASPIFSVAAGIDSVVAVSAVVIASVAVAVAVTVSVEEALADGEAAGDADEN